MSDKNNNNKTLEIEDGTVVIVMKMQDDTDGVQMQLLHFFDGQVGEDENQLFLNVLARGMMAIGYEDLEEVIEVGQDILREQMVGAANSGPVIPEMVGADADGKIALLDHYRPTGKAN